MKTLLLTGWTGYIASHTAIDLIENGYELIIMDNFSNSSADIIDKIKKITNKNIKYYHWDLRKKEDLNKIFEENSIDGVLHFAWAKAVGESCENPYHYYENNILGSIFLFEVMERHNVKNIIFSSSATVYNPSSLPPFSEETPTGETSNPYGTTKLVIENILRDLATHKNFNVINLRYFNPIWAHKSGLIWEKPNGVPNNLLPFIMKVANGEIPAVQVFWDDYNTPDGTWVRDYIHVTDLASWHTAAVKYIETKGNHIFENINLWTGNGTSVKEMITYTSEICGIDIPYKFVARRPWDIASAYCSPNKAHDLLSWKVKMTVQEGIQDSWNFICSNKD